MPDEQTDPDQGESPTVSCSVQDQAATGRDDTGGTATRIDDQSITSSKRHSPSDHQQPARSHSRGIFKPSRIALVVILSAVLGVVGHLVYGLTILSNPGLEPHSFEERRVKEFDALIAAPIATIAALVIAIFMEKQC